MEVLLALIGIALVFYILIPGLGAVLVRRRWRLFRNVLIGSRDFPVLDARSLSTAAEGQSFRFFGRLEAIEEDEVAWLAGESFRVPVSMRGEELYILRGSPQQQLAEPGQVLPQRLEWDEVENLAEGTKFFVFGPLGRVRGRRIFARSDAGRLLVVAYDGDPTHFMSWAIWSGRQRNEYWNHFTPVSLLIGSLLYLLLTIYLTNFPIQNFWLAIGLSAALVPVLPLFPPGIAFFLAYRRAWRRGRAQRAIRDVLALPLRYFYRSGNSVTQAFSRWKLSLAQGLPRKPAALVDGSEYRWKQLSGPEVEHYLAAGAQVRLADLGILEDDGAASSVRWAAGGLVFGAAPAASVDSAGSAGSENFVATADPMAEFLLTPPEPQKLVLEADKKARTLEYLAILAFIAGFALNAFLVQRLIHLTLEQL